MINQEQEDIYPKINGKDALEIDFHKDITSFPWRECQTREELEQYFNYGFDEVTYRMYLKWRQNRKLNNKQ